MAVTEIMRRIAELWRPLTDEQKQPWVNLSLQDKSRYDGEMATYDGPLRVPNKRAKKDPSAPKRACPAFLFYSQEMRHKIKVHREFVRVEDTHSCFNLNLSFFPLFQFNDAKAKEPSMKNTGLFRLCTKIFLFLIPPLKFRILVDFQKFQEFLETIGKL